MCKLSIIVPVYNVKAYLEECLNSIINQSFTDWEMIIIDDGSIDGSSAICDRYASSKIKIIHQKNAGLSAARNVGLRLAKGKYVSFIDSDDVILQDYLQTLVSLAEQHYADIICSKLQFYGKKSESAFIYSEILSPHEAMKQLIIQNKFNHGVCVKLFKSELAKQIEFPVGYTSEDVLYSFHAFRIASKIIYTNYSGYCYRVRENSIMTSNFSEKNFDLFKLLLTIKRELKYLYPNLLNCFMDKFFYCKLYYLKQAIALNNKQTYKVQYRKVMKNINMNFLRFCFIKSQSYKLFFKCLFVGLLPKIFMYKLPFKFISKLKKDVAAIIHNENTYR